MVSRHVLTNGLTVLFNEDHASPVAAVLTHVKTGYFQEEDRLAGISHLLEHMYFKGTPRRPGPEDIARATKALGGILNAFTYYEETGYYCVLPSERLVDALDIQADALANTRIDADELQRETEVVLQEGQQKHDSAWALATESLYALAFDRHRIRRWRIGYPEVLRSWTRDDVVDYYRGTYHPENMVLVLSGDVRPDEALSQVERFYGPIQGGPRYHSPGPEEMPQGGPRYRQMRGDIRQKLALLGFHTVPMFHPDVQALDVLSAILADGRSSRLFQNVRERKGLGTALTAYNQTFGEVGYFMLAAESLGDDIDATERALFGEVRKLQDEPPLDEEMERVRTRIRSRLVFDTEEPLGRARRLATYEALGGYELEEEEIQRLLSVTPAEVQRVAQVYFTERNASLLEYLPREANVREGDAGTVSALFKAKVEEAAEPSAPTFEVVGGRATLPEVAAEPPGRRLDAEQVALPGGGILAGRRSGSAPVISLELLWPGGRLDETAENAGITNLMLRTILKGNARRNGERIARAFESLGSSLEWLHGLDFWGFGFSVLSDRFEDALALAADVIQTPAFAEDEVRREKEAMFADIRRAQDSSSERALDLLDLAAYGDHPYSFPERGTMDALERITPEGLRAWNAARGEASLIAGAGGAVDLEALREALESLFPGKAMAQPEERRPTPWTGIVEKTEQRDRKQTAAALGFRTVDALDEDRFALDLLAQICSGLGGRFFAEVRGRQGLAYTVAAWHTVRKEAGMFVAYTATSPENEDRARASLLEQFARMREEPVTSGEIDRAKAYVAGAKTIALQTSRAQSRDLSRAMLYGRPVESSRLYVERIQALTAGDLQSAAQKYFHPENYALGALRGR